MFFKKARVGIDLGSANTVIYIEKKGIALREPSVVAIDRTSKEPVAFGQEAIHLIGKTNKDVEIIHPIKYGVVDSMTLLKPMLSFFIKKALNKRTPQSEIVICIPSETSQISQKALLDVLKELNIHKAMILEAPYAAALGAKLPIQEPKGHLVVDIGSAVTDIGVLSYNDHVYSKALPIGGDLFDQYIQEALRLHYEMIISEQMAQKIKQEIGYAVLAASDEKETCLTAGQRATNFLPIERNVRSLIISRAIEPLIRQIITGIQDVLEQTPPELIVDISNSGLLLSGGTSLLKRLPERLQKELNMPVHLAEYPMDVVALGAGYVLDDLQRQIKKVERTKR